jgi:hypothetical protein
MFNFARCARVRTFSGLSACGVSFTCTAFVSVNFFSILDLAGFLVDVASLLLTSFNGVSTVVFFSVVAFGFRPRFLGVLVNEAAAGFSFSTSVYKSIQILNEIKIYLF